MADFLLYHESDPARRELLNGLFAGSLSANRTRKVRTLEQGSWVLFWATYPGAPTKVETDSLGYVTLLLGEPLEHDSDAFSSAASVGESLRRDPVPGSHDGFFAAVSFHPHRHEVAIGVDIVGDFPIYHATSKTSFLASSRQDAMLLDDRVDRRIDGEGLVGILHSCGLLGHRTLHSGIARLPPRHVLRWSMGNDAVHVPQSPFETTPERVAFLREASDEAIAEVVWDAGRTALRRMTPAKVRLGMYLSGGLDSRNIAALAASEGWNPVCFTFGAPWEIEAVIAGQTARKLGWKRHRLSEPLGQYPTITRNLVQRERLANGLGFSFGPVHLDPSCLTAQADRILTGLEMDYLTKGSSAFEHPEELLEMGFTSSEMDSLCKDSSLSEPWKDVHTDLQKRYAIRKGFETMALDHRARFHVGSNFWRTAQGAWPVSPVFSRAFHETWMSLPSHAYPERRMQKVSIREKCPRLVGVPLDMNETSWYTLVPNRADRLCTLELRLIRKFSHLAGRESRYFSATYGIESSAWSTIRALAEPGRGWVESMVNPQALRTMIPPPGTPIPLDQTAPIPSSAPRKVLLGLMLLGVAEKDR
jgi:hypothetical protein